MNNSLLSPLSPIITAVSGGADSLCLLGTLHEQGYSLIVAHFDHQLRPDSAEDMRFVREIAQKYGHPFVTAGADVAAYAEKHKESLEEAARNLRYKFLFEQARLHHAQAVAVGHTADDQAETILMHFLRGAGLSGLKGMEARVILPDFDPKTPLVRPILHLWRAETEAYCAAHGLNPRQDPSNASLDYFRNRLRHELIPELEKYNPRFRETLQRTACALQGDYALIAEQTRAARQEILIAETQSYASFQLSAFAKLPAPLIRNLIKFSMEKLLRGPSNISFSTLRRAAQFITSPQSAQRIELVSGLMFLKEQDTLHLTDDPSRLPLDAFPQLCSKDFSPSLVIKTSVLITRDFEIDLGSGWILTITRPSTIPKLKNADPFRVALDAESLGETLSLRPRRAGDRFSPLGMKGQSMKLKDFMINVKLPSRARKKYPLLCAGKEIAWVPGYQIGHRFRVTEKTEEVLVFELFRRD